MSDSSSDSSTTAEPMRFSEIPILLFVRGLAFLSVVLVLFGALHVYIGNRLIAGPAATVWWGFVWAGFASVFVGFIGGRVLPRSIGRMLQWVGFTWMGTFAVFLSTTVLSDMVLWAASLSGQADPSWYELRRDLVPAIAFPLLALGFVVGRFPKTKRLTIDVPGLDAAFNGFRIVQISDIHIGETLGKRFAQGIVDRVNALSPDAVAITGDMIDGPVHRVAADVAPFGTFKSREGTFFVTGNHEYYSGASAWENEAARLGMHVLHNEHRVVRRGEGELIIAGVTDVEGGRFSDAHRPDVHAAFDGSPDAAPRILLAHQPRFAKAAKDHRVSLMLSGHTHGGQIFPFTLFVRLQQPVIAGLAVIEGVLTYTSMGTGYWGPPFRVGTRGEITEITLRASQT